MEILMNNSDEDGSATWDLPSDEDPDVSGFTPDSSTPGGTLPENSCSEIEKRRSSGTPNFLTKKQKKNSRVLYPGLCKDEDMLARRMALSMLTDVAEEADVKFYTSHVVPILEKLLEDKAPSWYECTLGEVYEHKSTISYGADVTHPNYRDTVANIEKLVAEERKYLGELFHRLCEDEDMLVRRMALSMLPAIAEDADVQFFASHVVPIFEKALEDKIGLHLEATQALIALLKAKKLSDDVYRHLLPALYKYAEDSYWQVRFLIANSINDAPTWYECTLGEVYEHKSTISYGADVTHPNYRDTLANIEKLVAEERKYLGELFHRLCEDEDMLVRRMGLSMLPAIAEDADVQFFASHVVPIFEKALEDKIGLHLEATQALIALLKAKKLSDDVYRHLLPVLYKYAEDSYWQVRFLIANSINDIHNSVSSFILQSSCFSLMLKFSSDAETRVRSAADRWFEGCFNFLATSSEV
ncbi:serine/threonine-protein phosphatase 2A 65 kDa regulatory subunit A beta isoform-like [Schistocerca americana]|uniref:serine/threonine-protein phosphatase 2A 65 kDa regulatory subunit A beta isoform-like n=1 Tax=Schistocerca americana TaxID=7009 RepID=UPI001F4FEF16|nr:serine/threonine-protein phosphatase 2A 65 kDa regulatory subunit A beta isoform-like [Schistocerca americana]